jgi:AraC-like DNA-binding protein
MSYRDIGRPIAGAQLMVQLARDHGLSLDQSLNGTGITPATLQDPAAEIRLDQEVALTRNVVTALKDVPALGLESGLRYNLATFGVYGFAIMSSSTVRGALDVAMRYHALALAFCRLSLRERDGELRMIVDDSEVPADLRGFSVERSLAAQARIWREVIGLTSPMPGLRLRMPQPPHAARLAEVCGATPEYGAPENSYAIDPALLDQPITFGNPLVAQQVEKECKALLERRRKRQGLAEKVRDLILHEPRHIPSLDKVASRLCMTARTLRRHLVTESTSYRELVEEVRQTLAHELLTRGRLKMEEVAERLGYADATSFSHAFRRWKGEPPRTLRSPGP